MISHKLLMQARLARHLKQNLRALNLAEEALAAVEESGADAGEIEHRVRDSIASLLPGYHLPMVSDPIRNAAWDKALRAAVQPGMRALEIGTGTGILALMAARAGAAEVTTCEIDPVLAELARRTIEANGYRERIRVVRESSGKLAVGCDLSAPADVLFCDLFSDDMVSFGALPILADARKRLLRPGAAIVPSSGMVEIALAEWTSWPVWNPGHETGFDLTALRYARPASLPLPAAEQTLRFRSDDHVAFRFEFGNEYPRTDGKTLRMCATGDGLVNCVVQ